MHGKTFYSKKHFTYGIVTDEPITSNGFYTCWYPDKQIYRRYNAEKITAMQADCTLSEETLLTVIDFVEPVEFLTARRSGIVETETRATVNGMFKNADLIRESIDDGETVHTIVTMGTPFRHISRDTYIYLSVFDGGKGKV